jgi:hypothetical protein
VLPTVFLFHSVFLIRVCKTCGKAFTGGNVLPRGSGCLWSRRLVAGMRLWMLITLHWIEGFYVQSVKEERGRGERQSVVSPRRLLPPRLYIQRHAGAGAVEAESIHLEAARHRRHPTTLSSKPLRSLSSPPLLPSPSPEALATLSYLPSDPGPPRTGPTPGRVFSQAPQGRRAKKHTCARPGCNPWQTWKRDLA